MTLARRGALFAFALVLAASSIAVAQPLPADVVPDPELADVYLRLAAAGGDAAVFDRLTANIEQAASPQVYERNVHALGQFTDSALVRRALEYALSPAVHAVDAAAVIAAALENRAARPVAWTFVKTRWKDIAAKGGADDAGGAILAAAATFCDPATRDDVKGFFGGRGLGSSRLLTRTLDEIQACIDFRSAQQENLQRWLAARQ